MSLARATLSNTNYEGGERLTADIEVICDFANAVDKLGRPSHFLRRGGRAVTGTSIRDGVQISLGCRLRSNLDSVVDTQLLSKGVEPSRIKSIAMSLDVRK